MGGVSVRVILDIWPLGLFRLLVGKHEVIIAYFPLSRESERGKTGPAVLFYL